MKDVIILLGMSVSFGLTFGFFMAFGEFAFDRIVMIIKKRKELK